MPGSLRIHDVAIAATNDGAWLGTSENYEVELIDWTGTTIRRIRWDGLDLAVTPQDVEWFAFDPDGTWIRTWCCLPGLAFWTSGPTGRW